jgi:hypothetical protein
MTATKQLWWSVVLLMSIIGVVETFWLALLTAEMGIWYVPQSGGDESGSLLAVIYNSPFILGIAVLGVLMAVMHVHRGARYVEAASVLVLGQFALLTGIATTNDSGETGALILLALFWTGSALLSWLRVPFAAQVLLVGLMLGALNVFGRLLDDDSTDMMIWPHVVVLVWWAADAASRAFRARSDHASSKGT